MQLSAISLAITRIGRASGSGYSPLSLFADSEQGAWYDPSDLSTMFQDAEGTTPVTADSQPVGLILDKSKGLVLGPELVTNGDFSNGTTGWDISSVTTAIEAGALKLTNTDAYGIAYQNLVPTVIGKSYKATALINTSNGTPAILRVNNGSNIDAQIAGGTTGTATIIFTAGATSVNVSVVNNSATVGAFALFANVSIKELAGNHASQATAAKKPLYKTNGTLHWLQFDGVDDLLASVASDFTATKKVSMFSGLYDSDKADWKIAYGILSGNAVASGSCVLQLPNNSVNQSAIGFPTSQGAFNQAIGPKADKSLVTTQLFDYTTAVDQIVMRSDSVQVATASGTIATQGFGTLPIQMGTGAIDGMAGNIYSLILLGRLATTQEITDTETWVNSKTGAY